MVRIVRLSAVLGTAALLATGCAPVRPDIAPSAGGSAQLAVLSSNGMGGWDVAVMSERGDEVRRIETGLWEATSLTYHPDGFFLTSDWQNVIGIEGDGETFPFNNDSIPSGVYRVTADPDGDVTVAQEYDVTELDPDGDVIASTNVPGTYCWMDSAPSDEPDGDAALIDVFGPQLATWDADSGTFDVFARNLGQGVDILGRTGSGDYIAASSYGDTMVLATPDGDVTHLGNLSSLGYQTWQVKAVEPASRDSVYALVEGSMGSAIVEVGTDGAVTEVATSQGQVWQDLVVF